MKSKEMIAAMERAIAWLENNPKGDKVSKAERFGIALHEITDVYCELLCREYGVDSIDVVFKLSVRGRQALRRV